MKKKIKSHWEKLNSNEDLATHFLFWTFKVIIGIAIIIAAFIFFNWFWCFTVSAQDIERKYDGKNKIRVYGYDATQLKTTDIYFCGGGFVSQNWQVCNAWKTMSVKAGHLAILVGYTTSFFPSKSAAETGINCGVVAYQYIIAHAQELGVDVNSIYLWGTSAGGFVALGIVYEKKQVGVKGIINGWGGVLDINYLSNSNVPVYNISSDYDKIVPVDCGDAFGVDCCGSGAIYEQLKANGIQTDWLVWEGTKHGLKPKQGYEERVSQSFIEAEAFYDQ
jgi:acetyl esterase/lipase